MSTLCLLFLVGCSSGDSKRNDYIKLTEPLVTSLNEMSAATSVGLNHERYTEKLTTIVMNWNKLKDRNADFSTYRSYSDFETVVKCYLKAEEWWQNSFQCDTEHARLDRMDRVKKEWQGASTAFDSAKTALQQNN